MKAGKLLGVAVLCVGIVACGGNDHPAAAAPPPPSQPPPPSSVTLSVRDVYALAQSRSDTDDPKMVNGGDGGSISGSDETSDPMAIE